MFASGPDITRSFLAAPNGRSLFCAGRRKMVITTGHFMLDVEPAERIYFFGPFHEESRRELKLTNTNRYQVAFKVKCTDNRVIRIDPPAGLLKIGETFMVNLATGPGKPNQLQNLFIMNIPASDTVLDARDAWSQHEGPESGMIQMEVAFEEE